MSRMRVNTQLLAIHFFVRGIEATIRWKVLLSNGGRLLCVLKCDYEY